MYKTWLYWGLVALGFLQMLGYVTRQKAIRGVGSVTVASPLPLVFSTVKGWETFSPEFHFRYQGSDDQWHELLLTPEVYAKLRAPYQYRNVLGAAISYGPILPEVIWQPVLRHAFIDPGSATQILGLEEPPKQAVIILKARTPTKPDQYELVLQ